MTSQAATIKNVSLPPRRPRAQGLPTRAAGTSASFEQATQASGKPKVSLPPRRPRAQGLPTRAVAVKLPELELRIPTQEQEQEATAPAAVVLPPKKRFWSKGMIALCLVTASYVGDVAYNKGDALFKPTLNGIVTGIGAALETEQGQRFVTAVADGVNKLETRAVEYFELDKAAAVANPYLTQAVDALKLPTLQKAVAAIRNHNVNALPDFSDVTLNGASIAGVLNVAKMWASLPQDVRAADTSIGSNLGLLLERMDAVERLDATYQTTPYQSYATQYYKHASAVEATELSEAKAARELAALEARIVQAHSTKTAATCSFEHTRVPSLDQCDAVLETLPRGYRIMVEFKAHGGAARTAVLTNPDAFAPNTAETIEGVVVKQGPWARFGL